MAFLDRFDFHIDPKDVIVRDSFNEVYEQYYQTKGQLKAERGKTIQGIIDSGNLSKDEVSLLNAAGAGTKGAALAATAVYGGAFAYGAATAASGTALASGAAGATAFAATGIGALILAAAAVVVGGYFIWNALSSDDDYEEQLRNSASALKETSLSRSSNTNDEIHDIIKRAEITRKVALEDRRLKGQRLQTNAEIAYNSLTKVKSDNKRNISRGLESGEGRLRGTTIGLEAVDKAIGLIHTTSIKNTTLVDARLEVTRSAFIQDKKFLTDTFQTAEFNKEQQEEVVAARKQQLSLAGVIEGNSLDTAETVANRSARVSLQKLSATLQAVSQLEEAQKSIHLNLRRASVSLDKGLSITGTKSNLAKLTAQKQLLDIINTGTKNIFAQEEQKAKLQNDAYSINTLIASLQQDSLEVDTRFGNDLDLLANTTKNNIAGVNNDLDNILLQTEQTAAANIKLLGKKEIDTQIDIRRRNESLSLSENLRQSTQDASSITAGLSTIGSTPSLVKGFVGKDKPRLDTEEYQYEVKESL